MTKDISLKAACADTFYYPPEWNPRQGSLDQFQRGRGYEHHFGKYRTKNLHKGILVIRFEMPFAVQCLRCKTYISQGVRYDADKKKVGKHFSTPIYEFAMRCRAVTGHEKSVDGRIYCNQRFVIRTDPKNCDYELAEGLRRKEVGWTAEDSGCIELPDEETKLKMQADPMFRAEKTVRNLERERSEKDRLTDLQDLQEDREDTYTLNCVLRRAHRQRRKAELATEEAERQAGKPNFAVPLQAASLSDAQEAAGIRFRTDHDKVEVAVKRVVASSAPLFKQSRSSAVSARIAELVGKRRRLMQHARMAQLAP